MILEINLNLMDVNLKKNSVLGPDPASHEALLRVCLLSRYVRLSVDLQLLFKLLKQL